MMIDARHVVFWSLTLVALAALLWLLHDVLLPFVCALALAYLQAPLADRLERRGLNRTVAALLMVAVVVLALIALVLLLVPILMQQGSALITRIPDYFDRVKKILIDPNLPWLDWLGSGNPKETL